MVVEGGEKRQLSDLKIGDRILTYEPNSGRQEYSEVIMFLDRDAESRRQFISLITKSTQLRVTPQHLVMRATIDGQVESVFAARISSGDQLMIRSSDGQLIPEKVLSTELVLDRGVFAPLTTSGTIVVDDVLASCYAVIESHSIAHAAFSPVRFFTHARETFLRLYTLVAHPISGWNRRTNITGKPQQGVHWYPSMLYRISFYILPESIMYN